MRVLRKGMSGSDVARWQVFLRGQGFALVATNEFDKPTLDATIAFQTAHNLAIDGVVGNQTFGRAMLLGFSMVADPDDTSTIGPNFPPPPAFRPLTGTSQRQKVFGKFAFKPKPLPNNKEHIVITDDWEAKNIERVPVRQLIGIPGASVDGGVRFHRLATTQFVALWAAWEKAKLLNRVLSYEGAFVPRFIRGSTNVLSNHAFGSAFDINASFNPLGAEPARVGDRGCVRELVTIAHEHGFYWGGHFAKRPDGMHFELATIPE
jgi:hypothetical protein